MRNGPPPDPASAAEVDDLRARLAEAEETLRAIGSGEADALVIAGSHGDEVQFLGSGQSALRQLIEALDQGTATLSADGVVLSCDASLARTLGRQVDELVGTSMAAYLSPEDYAALSDALALPETTPSRRKVRLIAGNGNLVPVFLSAAILHDSAEQRVSCVVFTNLEKVFSAEEALRESAERYRELVEFAPVGIGVVADGKIALVNAAALRLLGADSAEQLIGRPAVDIMHPDSLEDVQSRIRRMVSGEQDLFPAPAVCLRLDGTRMDVEITASPVSLGGVAAIQVVFADITKRKQAERALRQSEARYRGYVDNAPYGVFVSDEQGRYLEVNQAAADLTGYAREELVQLSIADVLAPESREWGQQHFARLLRTGRSSGEGVFLRKDGTSFPARVDAVRLTATRYLGFIVDVSEQQRAAAELEASAAQVKQALTATVAALGAATELRDPYTAGHQRRVAELAGAIAAGLGWDAARIEMVETAGLLHDVGKIIVPAEILARPGRLSELEMEIIRGHAAASAALIAGIEFGGPVVAIVNQHHERLDGSGYPRALSGEDILPEARILAVADVVEAMSSHRPYRPAFGMEAALAEVREHAGVKYDADVIAVCSRLIEEEGFQFTP
jgi:PAS domain S-box-containing protein/putative nucleotidyltransferase with HDIG domain